jgi:hypothetical protein
MSKTTREWLEIFDGTGLPYAKVNDLMDTLSHEHGTLFFSSSLMSCTQKFADTKN